MNKISKTILISLLLTSCTDYSMVSSSNSQANTNVLTSASSQGLTKLEDELKIKAEIDQLFLETIKKQKQINGNLSMYSQLEVLYQNASSNVRRKAIYHMSLNPKLDYYLTNSWIQIRTGIIIRDESKLFVPEDESAGFLIPYLITFPDEKYKEVNSKHKQYLFFENSNETDINIPWGSFNRSLVRPLYAMDTVPNELYWPKVLTIIPQPSIYNTKLLDFTMVRLLSRISVLATQSDYQDYIVYPNDGFGNKTVENYDQVFNEYIYRQYLDIEVQARNIIFHAQKILRDLGYPVEDKIFMGGYSGSGIFTNRFATIYPEMLKGVAHGGNLYPILPAATYQDKKLLFPLGTSENEAIFGKAFDLEKYNQVAKLEFFGKKEVWTLYPKDNLDRVDKLSTNLFGQSGYARLLNYHKAYFELGGQKVTIVNTDVGHSLHANDAAYMKEFFILNRDSDKPVYPMDTKYSNQIYISHLNLTNLESEIKANPANFLPYYEGTLLVLTSLVGNGTGGPHEEAAWARFQDKIFLAPYLNEDDLLSKHSVFLVVYDTTMRTRLKLNDLKINININPGEIVSTTNSDNKRVIVLYPKVDSDGVEMIKTLPADITTKEQRYQFNN